MRASWINSTTHSNARGPVAGRSSPSSASRASGSPGSIWEVTHSTAPRLADPRGRLRLVRQGDELPAGHRAAPSVLPDRERDGPPDPREANGQAPVARPQLEPCISRVLWLLDVPIEDEQWSRLDPPQRRQRTLDGSSGSSSGRARCSHCWSCSRTSTGSTPRPRPSGQPGGEPAHGRVLLLVNYRPEYRHGWGARPTTGSSGSIPWPPESAEEFLDALLGNDTSSARSSGS